MESPRLQEPVQTDVIALEPWSELVEPQEEPVIVELTPEIHDQDLSCCA